MAVLSPEVTKPIDEFEEYMQALYAHEAALAAENEEYVRLCSEVATIKDEE